MRAAQRLRVGLAGILCACLMSAPAATRAQNAPHPALWRVSRGPATIYLFGSLHVLPAGYSWSTPEINAAKAASDVFIFEVPVDEAALKDEKQFIIENGLLGRGQTLRGVLTPNEFQTYSTVLKRAGLKPQQFERYRPWLAAVVVGLAYLHGGNLDLLRGADDDVMDYARAHGRPLAYLESVRDQMSLLISGEEADHIKALKTLILGLPRSRAQESELLTGWAAGDADGFSARLDAYFRGHADAADLADQCARIRNWLPTIRDFLARPAGGTAMMTVGAAHVGGSNGLIALLCREGYAVERMRARNIGENACGPES